MSEQVLTAAENETTAVDESSGDIEHIALAEVDEWKTETLSHKPEEFEQLGQYMYIQRKGITEEKVGDATIYTCQRRRISSAAYQRLIDQKEEPAFKSITRSVESLYSDLQATQDDVSTLMMALAEVYEAVAVSQ